LPTLGCCSEKTPDSGPQNGRLFVNITLTVPDISCDHCKTTIEGAISQLTGVDSVTVDVEGRTVALDFDEDDVTLPEIVAALDDVGYEVSP
jgi:copper ion binding protein